jgi:hypothetical protein
MMAELLEGQREITELIAELIEVVKAPRVVFQDADGEIAGAVPMTKVELNEDTNAWQCARCEQALEACTCDDAGDDLLKA